MAKHKLHALLLSICLIGASGCGGTQGHEGKIGLSAAAPRPAFEAPVSRPDPVPTVSATEPAATVTPATGACPSLDAKEAFAMLGTFGSLRPEDKIKLSAGNAQAIWKEQAEAIKLGWPGDYMRGWRAAAWTKISVEKADLSGALITLHHGTLDLILTTRFEFMCNGAQWVMTNIGYDGKWYPAPRGLLPGQDGPLTEALALKLVAELPERYGTASLRYVATGNELEDARQFAIWYGTELTPHDLPIWTAGDGMEIAPVSADEAIGNWTRNGVVAEEKVRFRRDNGIWKVADHTDLKVWHGQPKVRQFPPSLDSPYAGLLLGWNRSQLSRMYPDFPDPKSDTWILPNGKTSVEFNMKGQLWAIHTSFGGTEHGLFVGDPVSQLEAIYGAPTTKDPARWTYREPGVVMTVYISDGYVQSISWVKPTF